MSSFQFEAVQKENFIEEFERWLEYGQKEDIFSEFEVNYRLKKHNITPRNSATELFSIFCIELRRDGQSISQILEDIRQDFGESFSEGINLRAKAPSGTQIEMIVDTKNLKKVVEEFEQVGFIKKWRNSKRIERRERLYGHIWNLFMVGFYRKGILKPPTKKLFRKTYERERCWNKIEDPQSLDDKI